MPMPVLKTDKKTGYHYYDFEFKGIRYKKSTKTKNREVADEELTNLYISLLRSANGIEEPITPKLFSIAIEEYISLNMTHWGGEKSKTYVMHNSTSKPHLIKFFGEMLLTDIKADHLRMYQNHRKTELTQFGKPPSNRTINIELGTLRQLLDEHKLWLKLKQNKKFKMLQQNKDTGKALTQAEVASLIKAAAESRSEMVLTALLFSIFTGTRLNELRQLQWKNVDFMIRRLYVKRESTKSDAGKRYIPLDLALDLLASWKRKFPKVKPEHYVFPSQRYANRPGGVYGVYRTDPDKPMCRIGVWKLIRKTAGVDCRWHDLRHTFGTMVARSGASRSDIKALMGHVSDGMMEVYEHSYSEDRNEAVAAAYKPWNLKEIVEGIINPANEVIQ